MNRHLLAISEGDESEDHLGAILWNASAFLWTKDQIVKGKLPQELNDLSYDKDS
jgi:hypothetical protein|tara:strand:+ start:744 stop:905 length:162 start_codon:yes stop_codon:yes gene_type:complete